MYVSEKSMQIEPLIVSRARNKDLALIGFSMAGFGKCLAKEKMARK